MILSNTKEHDGRKITMKKRFRTAILLILTLSFLFPQTTGCAPKEVEQTNESLRIAYYGTNTLISNPLYEFQQSHPDVEVTTDFLPVTEEDPTGDAFYTRIAAEIMSGKGPDITLISYSGMNAGKMMRSGTFVDLNEFIEEDPEFDLSKYNANVLKAGQVDGKQYIMPLTYTIPLVLTTQELLDQTGFDISTTNNYNAFLEECLKYKEANIPGAPPLAINAYLKPYLSDAVDYDTREVKVDTPENRETIRLNYEAIASQSSMDGYGIYSGGIDGAMRLKENKCLFIQGSMPLFFHCLNYRALKNTETPIQAVLRDAEGRLMAEVVDSVAINANSPNKQNAYEFIKLMLEGLSDQQQVSTMITIPVGNEAVRTYLEGLIGKEEKLSDLVQGDIGGTGEIETVSGLSQEDVDEYMGFLEAIDGAYIQEKDVYDTHRETIKPYYLGETTDLDGCIKNFEDKLKILASE